MLKNLSKAAESLEKLKHSFSNIENNLGVSGSHLVVIATSTHLTIIYLCICIVNKMLLYYFYIYMLCII